MQRTIIYRIDPAIFREFPGYVRGVVLATGTSNGPSEATVSTLLRDAEASVRARLTPEGVAEDPAIRAWREAFRKFGAKPAEHRSSIEAMVRRVLRGDRLPAVNRLVDLGNAVSLRYLLPVGSHGLDHLSTGRLDLRFAAGTETFTPFGSETVEHPRPGEVVFAEGDAVLTRRWVWRQANHTLTLPDTRVVEFNVDGLPPAEGQVRDACERLAGLVAEHCGGSVSVHVLSESQPEVTLVC